MTLQADSTRQWARSADRGHIQRGTRGVCSWRTSWPEASKLPFRARQSAHPTGGHCSIFRFLQGWVREPKAEVPG